VTAISGMIAEEVVELDLLLVKPHTIVEVGHRELILVSE
jgi:hypothetical protein